MEAVDKNSDVMEVERSTNTTSSMLLERAVSSSESGDGQWSAKSIVFSILLFVAAGFAEIGGGWLVWQTVRKGKPVFWAVFGSAILVLYGFIPTFQPSEIVNSFGRVYAVYGGFFIVLAALWGWALDGDRPDLGDIVGGLIALAGVLLMLFWPRN